MNGRLHACLWRSNSHRHAIATPTLVWICVTVFPTPLHHAHLATLTIAACDHRCGAGQCNRARES
ncbi:hypothetical protein E2C01_030859 [Portunus trituberculatus]|uniref:Uncharacterized protein n=1 Tax=Portunus trituberculatus TaxID=210409 RepID=A0A5B7EYI5_PORTR|nr:hypothetical protein [Portunus trituberculatus]